MKKTREEILAELLEANDPSDDDIALANSQEVMGMIKAEAAKKDGTISKDLIHHSIQMLIAEQQESNRLLESIKEMVKFFTIVLGVSLGILAIYVILILDRF